MHSMYFTILGWSSFRSKFISLSIDLMLSESRENKSICFIATVFAHSVSSALYTSPIAPFPISSPSCYLL